MTDSRLNGYRPPEGQRLTALAVEVVETGQRLGIASMHARPDMWMELVGRMLRGWSWARIAAHLGMSDSHGRKLLRDDGLPPMTEVRKLAGVCLFVAHVRADPSASIGELCTRIGTSTATVYNQCGDITGQTPGTIRHWSIADVLRVWSQEREAAA